VVRKSQRALHGAEVAVPKSLHHSGGVWPGLCLISSPDPAQGALTRACGSFRNQSLIVCRWLALKAVFTCDHPCINVINCGKIVSLEMTTSATLISCFCNVQSMLRHWIRYHEQALTCAMLIDSGSTDNSCDIIKELVPEG
jgi:hypothetical protein